MNFAETVRNIWAIEDLRKRVLYTFGLLAVYRLGAHIPTPGVDPVALAGERAGVALATVKVVAPKRRAEA